VTATSVAGATTPPAPDGLVAPPNPMHARLADSVSGRELIGGGYGPDVELAAATGVDAGVPWVRRDGFIEALPFALRPATEADHEFLFALKHTTMHDYLEATFGRSDDGAERDRFRPDLARTAVVSLAGVDVAMVESRVEPPGLYLANLQVAPAHQSAGLGAAIVGLLAGVAHARGRPLALRVLKVNTRAQQFYERLGFVVTGTVEPQWTMALPPRATAPATG
jgi:ribosomal protein S18 acetylase RimI-like enzyme